MKLKLFLVVCVAIFVVASPAAWADAEVPQEIRQALPIYPEIIRVFEKMDLKNGTGVIMAVKGSPEEVFDFYKKEMLEKKWEIVAERKDDSAGTAGLLLKKGNERIQVSVRKRADGSSTLILTLTKTETVENKAKDGSS